MLKQNSFPFFFTLVNIIWYSNSNEIIVPAIHNYFKQYLESSTILEDGRIMYKLFSLLSDEPFSLFIKGII